MRHVKLLTVLFAALMLSIVACDKDDDDNSMVVEISNYELSADNTTITVTFNQAVYKNADKTGDLEPSNFGITFFGANAVGAQYSVAHDAGKAVATISIVYNSRIDGNEKIEVTAKAGTFYGAEGNSVPTDLTVEMDVNELGILGLWSAYDISAILAATGFDDSLFANFYADQSYKVTAFMGGAPIAFEGSYEMAKSEFDEIWEITLNQSSPASLMSEGIFKVFPAVQDSMWYEVAQSDPAIAGVTPPTADAGFGSTSGGAYGTANIQKYYWVGQE